MGTGKLVVWLTDIYYIHHDFLMLLFSLFSTDPKCSTIPPSLTASQNNLIRMTWAAWGVPLLIYT